MVIDNKWLAGLIEGDGSFIVPHAFRDSQNRIAYPHIRIAFHAKDLPLAQNIVAGLGYGSIYKSGSNTIIFDVSEKQALYDLIDRVNGNLRTPKIHRLEALIAFSGYPNPLKDIDYTELGSNSWLAGMSDADSNFNIVLTKRKNWRMQRQWRLEFAQKTYHGYDQAYWAMTLSAFLNTTLYTRSRNRDGKIFSSFIVAAYNAESLETIEKYFDQHPLKSIKRLDYLDWKKCGELWKESKDIKPIIRIKGNMNNKRKLS